MVSSHPMIAALFDIEGTLFANPMGKGMTACAFSYGRGNAEFALNIFCGDFNRRRVSP